MAVESLHLLEEAEKMSSSFSEKPNDVDFSCNRELKQ